MEKQLDPSNVGGVPSWKPILNSKNNPEGTYSCKLCNKTSFMHPYYITAGLSACAGPGKCYETIDVIKSMIKFRDWTFLRVNNDGKKSTVHFICDRNHTCQITYDSLKKGGSCRLCLDSSRKTIKPELEKYTRLDCLCIGVSGKRPKICIHHNHKIDPNGGAHEWDYNKNSNVFPENVGLKTKTKYWYICSKEWCKMSYEQTPANRSTVLTRCPYCAGQKVCKWNCFEENYPHLAAEFDPSNTVKADEIVSGSNIKVKWIHKAENGEIHRWEASPSARTLKSSGCPHCNCNGHLQKIGGHEHFVAKATLIHNGKYKYLDEYRGSNTPLNIYCPLLNKNGIVHGNFIQTPHEHKSGNGCPRCNNERIESKLISDIQTVLTALGYVSDKNCFNEQQIDGLKYDKPLRLDKYIPELRLGIEGDGRQHFKPISTWGHEDGLAKTKDRDLAKDKYMMTNGFSFLRIPYNLTLDQISSVITHVINRIKLGEIAYVTYMEYYNKLKGLNLDNKSIGIMPAPK